MSINNTETFSLEVRQHHSPVVDDSLFVMPAMVSGGIQLLNKKWEKLYAMKFKRSMKSICAESNPPLVPPEFDVTTNAWVLPIGAYVTLVNLLERTKNGFRMLCVQVSGGTRTARKERRQRNLTLTGIFARGTAQEERRKRNGARGTAQEERRKRNGARGTRSTRTAHDALLMTRCS